MKGAQQAIDRAQRLLDRYGSRDGEALAGELGLIVVPRRFKRQKGVYMVIERNRYIFIKEDLHPVMRNIVLLHELGHDQLHRRQAVESGGFKEFNIFDMQDRRMEYEANVFAAHIALEDGPVLELIREGYDLGQIAQALGSDINLVALKVSELNRQGFAFREQEHRSDFLKAPRGREGGSEGL